MKHWHEEMPFTADNSLAELIFTENSLFFDIDNNRIFSCTHITLSDRMRCAERKSAYCRSVFCRNSGR